jgi:hypothetical protein
MTSALLALVLVLSALLIPAQVQLARTVQGEAGSCGRLAMLAVAHVYSRNEIMYADADPSADALVIAMTWWMEDDPTDGAVFLVSDADLESGLLDGMLGRETATFDCGAIGTLHAFTKKEE